MDMIKEKSLEEFRNSGLLLFVNQFLHIFGWAITIEFDEKGNCVRMFPAYCSFRGFSENVTTKAYCNITKHMEKRIPALKKDLEGECNESKM